MWIDDASYAVGDIGFLVRTSPQGQSERYSLNQRPAHTNRSHEPKLFGWCGETNNVSVDAEGLAEVVKILPSGRAQIKKVEATLERLEALGYPELES